MPLTTGAPAPAGIYWAAAIYASFSVTSASQLAMRQIPRARLHLNASPQIGMLPPQKFSLRATASLGMQVGTEETTSFGITSTAQIFMGQIQSTAFKLTATASLSFGGAGEVTGRQVNVAVSRAATI